MEIMLPRIFSGAISDGGAEHHGADHPLLSVSGNLELIGNKG